MTTKPEMYLAIARFATGGSSWATGSDIETAVKDCAKMVSRDWGSNYKLDNLPIKIGIYDFTGGNGWYADSHGVFDESSHEPIPYLMSKETTVPPYKRGR